MLPLAGYAERLSVRPGQTLRFHVANSTGAPVAAHVVRVLCADPNPAIGGVQTEAVPLEVTAVAEPGPQGVPAGSYAVLGPAGLLQAVRDCTFSIRVHPTLALPRRQVIVSNLDDSGQGLALELTPQQTVRATVGTEAGLSTAETASPVPMQAWTDVTLVVDSAGRTLTLTVDPIADRASRQTVTVTLAAAPALHAPSRCLSLASASDSAPVDTFNGRLERPVLLSRALTDADTQVAGTGAGDPGCIGAWDFARDMHTQRVVDTGPLRSPRHAGQHAHPRGVRVALDGPGTLLSPCARAVRRHPLPRRRPGRLRLARHPCGDPARRLQVGRLRAAAARRRRGERTSPSSWCRRWAGRRPASRCWCRPTPTPCTATTPGPSG
jgi:N,N-dimethylformamidase